jgi:ribosomal protein L33
MFEETHWNISDKLKLLKYDGHIQKHSINV